MHCQSITRSSSQHGIWNEESKASNEIESGGCVRKLTASKFKTLNSNCFELAFLVLLQSYLVFGHFYRLPEDIYNNFELVLGELGRESIM